MNPVNFRLRFSHSELAEALLNAKPPKGVKVSGSLNPIIRACHGADIVWNVNFDVSIPLTAFVVWLVTRLKKAKNVDDGKDETTRINDKDIPLKNRDVMLIIKSVLFYQKFREKQLRETQRRVSHKKKVQAKKKL
jgi:hypothetical protein